MFPTQWQTQALVVAVLLLLGCVASGLAFVSGVSYGREQIMVAWQQQRIAQLDAGQREAIAAKANLDHALRNWETERQDWNARLAAADARGRALAYRLRHSRGETGTGCLRQPSGSGVADEPPTIPDDGKATGTVDAALANHLAACAADAEQLTALQDWIKKTLH